MIFTRRLFILVTKPKRESAAIFKLDNALHELIERLSARCTLDETTIKDMTHKARKCKFVRAFHACIKIIKNYKDDFELTDLTCNAIKALLEYYDLLYSRAMESHARSLDHGRLYPTWYLYHKQRKVERYRKLVELFGKWERTSQNIRFQLILKHDQKLMNDERTKEEYDIAAEFKKKPKSPTTVEPATLPTIKEDEDEEKHYSAASLTNAVVDKDLETKEKTSVKKIMDDETTDSTESHLFEC